MGNRLDAVKKYTTMIQVGFKHAAGKASTEDLIKGIDESTAAVAAVSPKVGAMLAKSDEQVKRMFGLK